MGHFKIIKLKTQVNMVFTYLFLSFCILIIPAIFKMYPQRRKTLIMVIVCHYQCIMKRIGKLEIGYMVIIYSILVSLQ